MKLPETDRTRLLAAILAEKYGDDLNEWVARMYNSGKGVRPIAEQLTHATGVQVSWRSVARWVAEAKRAEREAA